jgi:serine/threonine protein kinase
VQGNDGTDATRRFRAPHGPDLARRPGGPPWGGPQATRRLDGPGDGLLGGRYRLEGRIGAGGMADVHRATDLRLQRSVAVKIFRPGADPDDERRFHQEAWTLANLNHPGLVAVHDFAVEDHRAYLVMELAEGPTLDDVLARERLSPDEITRIGADLADVLAYIHEEGVVHRDVKPSNLLSDRDGRIRLADFGISRLVGGTALTAVGATVGTPSYLSPEQVQGGPVGPPADIYALGLVLLEAATGRREYPGEGWDAAAARLSTPPAVPRGLPDPLRGALGAMTDTDPARRPTARQVTDMLADGLVEEEQPEQEPEQRGRTLIWALALVAFLAVLAAIVLATADDEEQAAEPATPPGTAENGGDGSGGFGLPDLPSFEAPELPDVPEMPDLPDLPEMPEVPQVPDSVADDAQGMWEQFTDWLSGRF